MKTPRQPLPLTDPDRRFWRAFQRKYDLQVDGIVGHQTTGQIVIVLEDLMRSIDEAKQNATLFAVISAAVLFAGGMILWWVA